MTFIKYFYAMPQHKISQISSYKEVTKFGYFRAKFGIM